MDLSLKTSSIQVTTWLNVILFCLSPYHAHGKLLWATSPATSTDIIQSAYPLGNGRLGLMPFGGAGSETLNVNLDSLWSGGPFEAMNYTGGNPNSSLVPALNGIREWIFANGTGNVTQLLGNDDNYGSYRVLGNLSITIPSIRDSNMLVFNYTRALNLSNGIHTTSFSFNRTLFETTVFCSFPDQVCVYIIQASESMPPIQVRLYNDLVYESLKNTTCGAGFLTLHGLTQLGPPEGMRYDAMARIASSTNITTQCNPDTNVLSITSSPDAKKFAIVLSAETNYDAKHGTAKDAYSFRGHDPAASVENTTLSAATKMPEELQDRHIEDFESWTGRFELDLPDSSNSAQTPTAELIAQYQANSSTSDPYLESLLFDYSQYLFISSSRSGSLPPNLQGRWSEGLFAAWSGDYHANINLQMNHWTAEQTGLNDLQSPLWDYMANTWVSRGTETAKLLYNAPGWVVHDEMNVFGHTGMKSGAQWADYPAAAAWMMQHVFDHWDYSLDVDWLKLQGYPLLKGIAEFWLSQLQEDIFSRDGTIVVNPCNSPEHGPTTFGCAHYQQLISQVFHGVLSVASAADETDSAFVANITSSLSRLDKGFHIGNWGQIKEWKIPDSYGYEPMNDTHRHLSELVGWYPGYALSSLMGGYSNATIQNAVAQKLYSRGVGNGPDANAGWEKVWRSACWARLNNTERAYFELRYAIEQNFAANGLSMYSGTSTPFQIDANFGLAGAMLSMLIVDLPVLDENAGTRTVILGPAIPEAWYNGSVKGLKLRGGGEVDFQWDEKGVVTNAELRDRKNALRVVNKDGFQLTGA